MTRIRFALPSDTGTILGFIRALADYEKLSAACIADEPALQAGLFGPKPFAEVLLAEDDGTACGFALFFHSFSTFLGKPGLYLEDLFVSPEFRGRGHGRALLASLAGIAVERGCGRLEWSVLNWNQPAIDFYLSLGAKPLDGWSTYRIDGTELKGLAGA